MDTNSLLQKLPSAAAEAIQTILSAPQPTITRTQYHNMHATLRLISPEQKKAIADAFEAVAFPPSDGQIPPASSLSEAQRALATLLADVIVPLDDWAIPQQSWLRKRWLGLVPAGPLERPLTFDQEIMPLWLHLSVRKKKEHEALLSMLSTNDLLQTYGELAFNAYDLKWKDPKSLNLAEDDGKEWAPAYADWLLALFSSDAFDCERAHLDTPSFFSRRLLFTVLLHNKIPIEPRWDTLLFISVTSANDEALTRAILRALPEERRNKALLANVQDDFTRPAIKKALALIGEFPSDALLQFVLEHCSDVERLPKRTILLQLQSAVQPHPTLLAQVSPIIDALPALPVLRWKDYVYGPSPDQITAHQRAQCKVGSSGMMGAGYSWCDNEEIECLALGSIVDADDNPQYEAAIYLDEDGTIFRAGTLEPVAWLCQERLDCEDPLLKESLQLLLADKPQSS